MSCCDWIICSVWTQDGQCPSEGAGEGVSELEVGALQRGDSAEVEMQVSWLLTLLKQTVPFTQYLEMCSAQPAQLYEAALVTLGNTEQASKQSWDPCFSSIAKIRMPFLHRREGSGGLGCAFLLVRAAFLFFSFQLCFSFRYLLLIPQHLFYNYPHFTDEARRD